MLINQGELWPFECKIFSRLYACGSSHCFLCRSSWRESTGHVCQLLFSFSCVRLGNTHCSVLRWDCSHFTDEENLKGVNLHSDTCLVNDKAEVEIQIYLTVKSLPWKAGNPFVNFFSLIFLFVCFGHVTRHVGF